MYCHTFFCSHKFHIIENYLIFKMLKKKIWAISQRIIEMFTQKIVTKLSKIWVWDPGSEIWDPIPDPGVKKAPDPDPQHWERLWLVIPMRVRISIVKCFVNIERKILR